MEITPAEQDAMKKRAANLVRRSRYRDQNATAEIVAIRESAEQGSERAKLACKYLWEYLKSNPIGPDIGEDPKLPETTAIVRAADSINTDDSQQYAEALITIVPTLTLIQAVVALANGPSLLGEQINSRIKDVFDTFQDDEKFAFQHGFDSWKDRFDVSNAEARIRLAWTIGRCLGYAQMIQYVRQNNTPFAPLCAKMAWELGE
jgi:hypothetical protein